MRVTSIIPFIDEKYICVCVLIKQIDRKRNINATINLKLNRFTMFLSKQSLTIHSYYYRVFATLRSFFFSNSLYSDLHLLGTCFLLVAHLHPFVTFCLLFHIGPIQFTRLMEFAVSNLRYFLRSALHCNSQSRKLFSIANIVSIARSVNSM